MTTINRPTINVKNFAINEIYISADDTTVNQYCTLKGYTLVNYVAEPIQRFSSGKDGGALPYQYYDGSKWVTEFGFSKIVEVLNIL